MTRVITTADVDELEESGVGDRAIAETLTAWTEEAGVRYSVDVSPAELISLAATYYGLAGDDDAQWRALERARAADGGTAIDVEAKMISALARRGQNEAAVQLADELRRAGVASYLSYGLVAESLADIGEERAGIRWLNMGLRAFDRYFGDDPDEDDLELLDDLVLTRLLIRRRLGMAPDSYDEQALSMRADAIEETEHHRSAQ